MDPCSFNIVPHNYPCHGRDPARSSGFRVAILFSISLSVVWINFPSTPNNPRCTPVYLHALVSTFPRSCPATAQAKRPKCEFSAMLVLVPALKATPPKCRNPFCYKLAHISASDRQIPAEAQQPLNTRILQPKPRNPSFHMCDCSHA